MYVEDDVFVTPQAIRTLVRAISGHAASGRRPGWYLARYRDGLGNPKFARRFNMDFFAHDGRALTPAHANLWQQAYHRCVEGAASNPAPHPLKGASPPGGAEGVLWGTVNATRLRVHVLLPTTFHGSRRIDAMGIWHLHNASEANDWLASYTSRQRPA